MRIFNFPFTHFTLLDLFSRLLKILKRYGLSTRKMESNLRVYLEILRQKDIVPTFPISAHVIRKHSELITKLASTGVEFAIHGYKHIDHTELTHNELLEQIERAINIFQEKDIPFSGFRFPYLRWNADFIETLGRFSLKWDSSDCILWNVISNMDFRKRNLRNFQYMLGRYDYKSSTSYISLPRRVNNVLEIPVSLPDDDLLERLGVSEINGAGKIWGEILSQTHSRGELFTLQLHPERITLYNEALTSLIENTQNFHPGIWIASLDQIFDWWNEKVKFAVSLDSGRNGEYKVNIDCSQRATVLVRTVDLKAEGFFGNYSIVEKRNLRLRSPKRPVIGISKYCSPRLSDFLKNEGFIFEVSEEKEQYSVYLDGFTDFSEDDGMKILEMVDAGNLPLIRFWRWPDRYKSCFSITGDIDSITLYDFFDRWE